MTIVLITHIHIAVLWPFVRDNPGRPVPEQTFTHSHLKCQFCASLSNTLLEQNKKKKIRKTCYSKNCKQLNGYITVDNDYSKLDR